MKSITTSVFLFSTLISSSVFASSPPVIPIQEHSIHVIGQTSRVAKYYNNGVMQVPLVIRYDLIEGYSVTNVSLLAGYKPLSEYRWEYVNEPNEFNKIPAMGGRSTESKSDLSEYEAYVTPGINSTYKNLSVCYEITVEKDVPDGTNYISSFNSCDGETNNSHISVEAFPYNSITSSDFKFTNGIENSQFHSIKFTTTKVEFIGEQGNQIKILSPHGLKEVGSDVWAPNTGAYLLKLDTNTNVNEQKYDINHRSAVSIYIRPGQYEYALASYYGSDDPYIFPLTVNNELGVIATYVTTSDRKFRKYITAGGPNSITRYCKLYIDDGKSCQIYAINQPYSIYNGSFTDIQKTGVIRVQDSYGTVLDIPFSLVDSEGRTNFGQHKRPLWVSN